MYLHVLITPQTLHYYYIFITFIDSYFIDTEIPQGVEGGAIRLSTYFVVLIVLLYIV